MFEFRLRILDVRERESDPPSFLGIVEGFPHVLVHATTASQAERDLTSALVDYVEGLRDQHSTRIEWDDYPTTRVLKVYLGPPRT
jgi:hypothetical protein